MRAQIARLERELADAFVTAYPMGGIELPVGPGDQPGCSTSASSSGFAIS